MEFCMQRTYWLISSVVRCLGLTMLPTSKLSMMPP